MEPSADGWQKNEPDVAATQVLRKVPHITCEVTGEQYWGGCSMGSLDSNPLPVHYKTHEFLDMEYVSRGDSAL